MLRDDEEWLALADQFQEAAIEGASWYDAVAALATATGSEHGQLVCMGPDGSMPLNLLTNVDPALPGAFVRAGGTDPSINPRRRAGLAQRPLTILAESDFITPGEVSRDLHYQEFALPWDVPFICLTTLERRPDQVVGLACIRNRLQGHIDEDGRRVFASFAPLVRSAVRTTLALGETGEIRLASVFDSLSIPAYVCDRYANVLRMTQAAEALLEGNTGLRLRAGKLGAEDHEEASALGSALAAAAEGPAIGVGNASVVVHARATALPLVLDVVPLPRAGLPFAADARVLVLARDTGNSPRRIALMKAIYGLTSAELDIAQLLIEGKSTQAIADSRQVSIGTVRAQIKSLFAKTGSRRQADLVTRLARL